MWEDLKMDSIFVASSELEQWISNWGDAFGENEKIEIKNERIRIFFI